MHALDMITAKRDGQRHSDAQLRAWIDAVAAGTVPDYQAAAWLMAVFLRGMDAAETHALTVAMADSGRRLDLSVLGDQVVDKHSTGGVGDKTTLVVGPLAAAMGLTVAKMSGRGLGHTGGTLDKLESVPGLKVAMSPEAIIDQARRIGLVIAGQSQDLAPADKILYALRDVTATVPSLPLIASSIMSKKLASGAPAIVLDVKVGGGAFMKTLDEARALAEAMAEIGRRSGLRMACCLSRMDAPLGRAVGNALELREAIATLRGEGPSDLHELSLTLVGLMQVLALHSGQPDHRRSEMEHALRDGSALGLLRRMIEAQGGDGRVIDEPERLPTAPVRGMVTAEASGWVTAMDAEAIGRIALDLGAGRRQKEDAVDPAVGIVMQVGLGDRIAAGRPLAEIHAQGDLTADTAAVALRRAVTITDDPLPALPAVVIEQWVRL